MSRVFKPKNYPPSSSAGLGSAATLWITADTATRVNANPEFTFPPGRNASCILARHNIHRLTSKENQYVV
jgi:hypothetical protein